MNKTIGLGSLDDWSSDPYIACMTQTTPETTRDIILRQGHALVLTKGFHALGLQEILTAAGVPKGSFYHYFASKQAFGCALLERYVQDYRDRLDPVLTSGTGRERLMRYFTGWMDADGPGWAEDCLVVKLAAELADLPGDMRQILSDGTERLIARLADVIRDGRKDGSLSPAAKPKALAQTLYQMWLGAALLSRLTRNPAPLERALSATGRLLDCTE